MGFEPMTPVLPRLCATTAPHGPAKPTCTSSLRAKARALAHQDDPPLPEPAAEPAPETSHPCSATSAGTSSKPPHWGTTRVEQPGGRWRIRTSAGFRRLIYSQFRLSTPATALVYVPPEPAVGIEPTTYGLQNRCSAIELRRPGPRQAPAWKAGTPARCTLIVCVIAHVLYSAKQRAVKAYARRYSIYPTDQGQYPGIAGAKQPLAVRTAPS